MPKNKDLKRLVRARMAKTGESYTAARAQIVGESGDDGLSATWLLPPDHEGLAGQTDATMLRRTGRSWSEWVQTIDAFGGREQPHPAIAREVKRLLEDEYGWWAQTVTVGYERLIGRRAVGMTCDGDFQASKSKTVRATQSVVFDALRGLAEDPEWLGPLVFHGATEPKSLRFREDGSHASLWLADKGGDRCTVSVSHTKLATADDVTAAKEAWARRLGWLAEVLAP